jgi:hypothetical protein
MDSWPRTVPKLGYAVTLRACSVRCRYLAVASKGWYGYGLSMSGRTTWHVTTVRSSRLQAPVTNWEPHGVTLAGHCYAMRHGMKVQIVTAYRVSQLQRYGVTVRGNVTSVYPSSDSHLTSSKQTSGQLEISTKSNFFRIFPPWKKLCITGHKQYQFAGLLPNSLRGRSTGEV